MKTKRSLITFLSALAVGAFTIGHSFATVIYEDNFVTANTGDPVNGRQPNLVNTGSATYTASSNLVMFDTGPAVSQGTGTEYANLALPSLTASDTVILTLNLRPISSDPDNWIGLGFTDTTGNFWGSNGGAWAILTGAVPGSPSAGGNVVGFSGPGPANIYFNNGGQAASFGGTSGSQLKLTYTVGTGNMKIDLSSINGSATLYNGLIDYAGVPGDPAPTNVLNYATFQFNNQNNSNEVDIGFVSHLKVEVIPEPTTVGLILLSGSLMSLFLVKRRRLLA